MDAARCISYLTIELKGTVPRELRAAIENRVFGCDICQETCPWEREVLDGDGRSGVRAPCRTRRSMPLVDLARRLLPMSGKRFRREFADSPVARAGRNGLLRNVCIALGNWGSARATPALREALADRSPLVRGHAAWALGRIGTPAAARALADRRDRETDPDVRKELGTF